MGQAPKMQPRPQIGPNLANIKETMKRITLVMPNYWQPGMEILARETIKAKVTNIKNSEIKKENNLINEINMLRGINFKINESLTKYNNTLWKVREIFKYIEELKEYCKENKDE
jgi:hypothetical protein